MKKAIIILVTSAACIAFWAGCQRGHNFLHPVNMPEDVWLKSYVMAYYTPQYIRVRTFSHEGEGFPGDVHMFSMHVIKGSVDARYDDTDPVRVALFDSLCKVHDDMTFNRTYHLHVDGGKVEFPSMDLASIEVACLGQPLYDPETGDIVVIPFDAAHPAGASVNDLLHCRLNSAQPFISGGYEDSIDIFEDPKEFFWSYIEKPLSEVGVDDLRLLGTGHIDDFSGSVDPDQQYGGYSDHIGLLIFNEGVEPDEPGNYTFRITMTPSDGSEPYVWVGDMEFPEHAGEGK